MGTRAPLHYAPGDSPADRVRRDAGKRFLYEKQRRNDVTRAFYKSKQWGQVRRGLLAQQPWCVVCGARARHVDHIVPLRQAWDRRLDPTNLQNLCHSCHSRKTAGFAGYKEFDY